MNQRTLGRLLASAQFLLCVALIWAGHAGMGERPWLWTGFAAGVAIGGGGVWAMRASRVRVTPEPGADAELCERGIYGLIRHPMYSGLLLAFAMIAIAADNWIGWTLWAALFGVLIAKLRLEEKLWCERDPRYHDYMQRTKRLVPWLW